MSHLATPEAEASKHAAKHQAALSSVLAATGITILKLLAGLITGSLGMLSDAAHSGVDLVAAAITLFSIRIADRPADATHNYGHGKIESLSAFIEMVIMLGSSIWILTEAILRIVNHTHLTLTASYLPFLVLILSITVDFTRSRNLRKIALQHHSEALEADALHYSTDIWSSCAVLLGLIASFAGKHWNIPALELADPIAAIVVSIIILHVCWQLALRTVAALTDATPDGSAARHDLIRDLATIDGVLSVERLRTRRSGPNYFADVSLGMPRNVTFQHSEQITAAATAAVQRHLPDADVVIHSIPTASLAESVHDRIRAVAARANLSIHDVVVQQIARQSDLKLHVELHLEVNENMPLRRAHDLVTQLESDMRREVPEIASILTHIESERATIEQSATLERNRTLEHTLRNVAQTFPEIQDIHDVVVTRTHEHGADRIQVNCHCTLPDDLPMSQVHALITALENTFKLEAPEVSRLLIHPEPATDNRR